MRSYSDESGGQSVTLPTLEQMQQKKQDRLGLEGDGELGPLARKRLEQTYKHAAVILQNANDEAQEILNKAIAEAEEKKHRLLSQAQEQGYADGLQAARQQLSALSRKLDAAYGQAIDRLAEAHDQFFAQFAQQVWQTVEQIAQSVMGMELETRDGAYQAMVEKALRTLASQDRITLRVSTWEYGRFFEGGASTLKQKLDLRNIDVREDGALAQGDFRLETEYGFMEAGLKLQMEQLGYALQHEQHGNE